VEERREGTRAERDGEAPASMGERREGNYQRGEKGNRGLWWGCFKVRGLMISEL